MDVLVPVTDGHTETEPTIYTYGKPTLVLVAVPGEGISAHYTDGYDTSNLPINNGGAEKALRIERQSLSENDGPTTFDRGTSLVEDMLVNSALIIQIPVDDPQARRRHMPSFGGLLSMGAGLETTRSATFSPRGLDSGNLGTEAGVVSAGGDIGEQKQIPGRIRRDHAMPIRADFVVYAATDAQVISPALARRMRSDMDAIIDHPACRKAGSEN
jgi:hypothetical protein